MKVVHFQRKRDPERFSIEGYFERVRACVSNDIDVRLRILPCFSRGLVRRLVNVISVVFAQGDVNHITGDVHYVALLMRKHKTVLTVHDCEILNRLSGWKRWMVELLWYRLPVRRVAAITVNSCETRKRLLEVVDFPADRIAVIPVSVSDLYQPLPKLFNTEVPEILQIGTKANKNVIRLAQALNGLPCRLHIVGPVSDELRDVLNENQLDFQSHDSPSDRELYQLYCRCDIVSFISTYEGFGMPIVEAQRVERVCVTSDCSSMPEIGGDGACYVNPFDVKSMRTGFERVVADSEFREQIIEAGRINRLRFDTQTIAQSFQAIYQQLITGEAGSSDAF